MKLMKDAYAKLVDENVEWLRARTEDCLERRHIIAIVERSVETEYPDEPVVCCPACDNTFAVTNDAELV